jgi:hypothetical protein
MRVRRSNSVLGWNPSINRTRYSLRPPRAGYVERWRAQSRLMACAALETRLEPSWPYLQKR